jgi:hypothetical protein
METIIHISSLRLNNLFLFSSMDIYKRTEELHERDFFSSAKIVVLPRIIQRHAVTTMAHRPVRLAYQPPASSAFLLEQTRHQQPANNTFLSEQTSTSHQPLAKRIGCMTLASPHVCRNCCEPLL